MASEWIDKPFKTDFMDNCRNNFRTVEGMAEGNVLFNTCHFAEQKRDRFVAWD